MASGSFDDTIRQEMRMSSRDDGQSARDRAARRMNVKSGKNPNPRTSTAYKEDKPRQSVRKGKSKSGGKKRGPVEETIDDTLPNEAPIPTPRPEDDTGGGLPWWMSLIPGYRPPGPTAPVNPAAPPGGGGGGGGGPAAPVGPVPPGGSALPIPLIVPPIDPRRMQPDPLQNIPPGMIGGPQSVPLARTPNAPDGLAIPYSPSNTPEDAIIQHLLQQQGGGQLALPPPSGGGEVPIDVPTEDIEAPARPRVRRAAPTRPMRVPVG